MTTTATYYYHHSFIVELKTKQGKFPGPRKEVETEMQRIEQVLRANDLQGYQK